MEWRSLLLHGFHRHLHGEHNGVDALADHERGEGGTLPQGNREWKLCLLQALFLVLQERLYKVIAIRNEACKSDVGDAQNAWIQRHF